MQMSNRNIVKEYKESKNKAQQIKILADMNLCAPKDIKKILIEAGCEVPGNSIPKKAKVAPVQQKKPNVSEAVVEPEAEKYPKAVLNAIFARMDSLEGLIVESKKRIDEINENIKEYESEYRELANYLK